MTPARVPSAAPLANTNVSLVSIAPGPGAVLDCAGRSLDLRYPRIMGVLNITPDSFSDGGRLYTASGIDRDALCQSAEAMVAAGAAVLDIGGESTRPGASAVTEQEEADRVLGALEILASRFDTVLSIDTSTPSLMTEASRRGAGLINDVRALCRPGALVAAASSGLPVCLMHMQGDPGSMQDRPTYGDVVADVSAFLRERQQASIAAGIPANQLLFDPGFGFGKTLEHNFTLLQRLEDIVALGPPVLVGLSRKSMIEKVLGRPVSQRLYGSLALAVLAATKGARLIRVHDVSETMDALAMVSAMEDPPVE